MKKNLTLITLGLSVAGNIFLIKLLRDGYKKLNLYEGALRFEQRSGKERR